MRITRHIIPFLILTFILLTINLSSQDLSPIQTGPRITLDAVFNNADALIVKNDLGVDSLFISSSKNTIQYGLGMFMQFNLKEYLFLRPEAIVHISNRNMSIQNLSNSTKEELTHRIYSFSLPIQIGYRIDKFSLQTGIVWNNQLRTALIDTEKEGFKYELGSSYTTYTIGLGFQSNWFLIDMYYETPLGKVDNLVSFDTNENRERMKHNHLSIRLGFILSGRD